MNYFFFALFFFRPILSFSYSTSEADGLKVSAVKCMK